MKKLVALFVLGFLAISIAGFTLAEENDTAVGNETAEVNNSSPEIVIEVESNDSSDVPDNTVVARKAIPRAEALFCEGKGYVAKTRTDSTGKDYNVCIFPDGKECLQLEFLRGKCGREYLKGIPNETTEDVKEDVKDLIQQRKCADDCAIEIDGDEVIVRDLSAERSELIANKISARTGLKLSAEDIDNKTVLRAYLSNGRWALVKQMPDAASEKALEALNAKCAETGCTIELKEVGTGDDSKLVYVLRTEKDSRILYLFNKKMPLEAQVDAESGELVSVKKPWWTFMAKEVKEEAEADDTEEVSLETNTTA
jgi:putative hemolysin